MELEVRRKDLREAEAAVAGAEAALEDAQQVPNRAPTRLLAYSPTRLLAYSPTRLLAHSPTRLLAHSPTRLLIAHSPTRLA